MKHCGGLEGTEAGSLLLGERESDRARGAVERKPDRSQVPRNSVM